MRTLFQPFLTSIACLVLACGQAPPPDAPSAMPEGVLFSVIDMDVGEAQQVRLHDGTLVEVRLIDVRDRHDHPASAVRASTVTVEVDGTRIELVSANYRLPTPVAGVQVDAPVTKGYLEKSRNENPWGLRKDARLRIWPGDSPWIRPGSFYYPIKQRWFASSTQMANEPVYVDGGDVPGNPSIYYHTGLDIGGAEGLAEVIAATDGLVVSVAGEVMPGYEDAPIAPRYDVVNVLDGRGWYYRYSHLYSIDPQIKPGASLEAKQQIGLLGKEGGSGGWSHLHFEIRSKQPSGEWGTNEGYAFLWEAYRREYEPALVAVARPHHFVEAGETVQLEAGRSWSASGDIASFDWYFTDGDSAQGERVERKYDAPGSYSEILKVTDGAGNVAYDFAIVQVADSEHPDRLPPTIHAAYAPTTGTTPGMPVTFKVRSFRTSAGGEVWDFGDGSEPVSVQSDGNREIHAPDGYAVVEHRFAEPGDYVVRVEHTNEWGYQAVGHLHIAVIEE